MATRKNPRKNLRRIPFNTMEGSTKPVAAAYLRAVKSFLQRNNFVLTKEVSDFENAWAKAIGTKYAVGVSNGADALFLALTVLGIGPGDEVITQGNAYNASVTAILRTGATPRFADISLETFQMDIGLVEPLINEHTKAILPVHLFGASCDMDTLVAVAKKHNLSIVEDCAQAHLGEWNGKKLGSFGDVSAFSFYPTKNLGAFGDAGALVTSNKEIYEKLLVLRNLGQSGRNNHVVLGYNMRLDPLQAIALSLKLKLLKAATVLRRKKAEVYLSFIKKAGVPVALPSIPQNSKPVFHLFVVALSIGDRAQVMEELKKKGIETAIHYPVPVYRQPFWVGEKPNCPHADKLANTIISLPFYPDIKETDQKAVIEALNASLRKI